MPDLITLTCPTCGAKLKLGSQVNLLVCASCGNEHMVHRDGGAIYLAPMVEDVRQIRTGVDKTAAELAVARLKHEIQETKDEYNLTLTSDFTPMVAPAKSGWVIAIGTLFLVLSFASLLLSNMYGSITFAVLGIGSLIWIGQLEAKRRKKAEWIKRERLQQIATDRWEKEAALRRNIQIASS